MAYIPEGFDPHTWHETISQTPPQYQRFFLFAMLAAAMNYLHMARHGKGKIKGYQARINLITAAMTGVLIGWAAREVGLADAYVNAIVAVSGYVGGDLLDMAGKALKQKLGKVLDFKDSGKNEGESEYEHGTDDR